MTPDQRFQQLGLTLPPAPTPLGVYKPFLIVDKFVYVSGHGTVKEDRSLIFVLLNQQGIMKLLTLHKLNHPKQYLIVVLFIRSEEHTSELQSQ